MLPSPRAKLNIKPSTPPPQPEPEVEVTVVQKTGKDGNEILVDEKTNDVYDADGRFVGLFRDGEVFAREDASV